MPNVKLKALQVGVATGGDEMRRGTDSVPRKRLISLKCSLKALPLKAVYGGTNRDLVRGKSSMLTAVRLVLGMPPIAPRVNDEAGTTSRRQLLGSQPGDIPTNPQAEVTMPHIAAAQITSTIAD